MRRAGGQAPPVTLGTTMYIPLDKGLGTERDAAAIDRHRGAAKGRQPGRTESPRPQARFTIETVRIYLPSYIT